ncbi:MAG: response regulator transcription factor [Dehalococcoidia bacterium]|nr:response regulator transcription factor [Dehalococcoidia bacterium]
MADAGSPVDAANSTKVALVEDENLFRELLRGVLAQQPGLQIVGAFADAASALQAIPLLKPQVAVLDIELGGDINGIQLGLLLRQSLPRLGIVLLSNHSNTDFFSLVPGELLDGWSYLLKRSVKDVATVARAIEAAADGLTVLDPEIARARRATAGGGFSRLSARQLEVLGLMAQGYSNAAIASKMVLSEKTVENYINLLYRELAINPQDSDVNPRVKAVRRYLEESLPRQGS